MLGVLLVACGGGPREERVRARPSILLVTIDTVRADHVGCYGSTAARTPNLDRLAAEGVRFEEARSHVPLTAPSHATMLTGVLPPRHGVRGNGAFRLRPEAPSLPEALRRSGYGTAAVVASVVLDRATGLERGFDTYEDNQRQGPKAAFRYLERGASQIETASLSALEHLKPPFFLWVHLYDPHVPWVSPLGEGYDAEIAFADAALGNIVRAAAARAAGDLVVVATSDHGESLGEHGENQHGYTLHRGVLRVPLLLAGPGIPRGRTVAATVGLVDLAPTLADLAGVPLPGAFGLSLRRHWEGEGGGEQAPLWEETLHPLLDAGWAPLRGLLDPRWHFVDAPRPELYDRQGDPDDRVDVAAQHPEQVQALRRKLLAERRSLSDTDPEPQPDAREDDLERRERLAALGYVSAPSRVAPAGGRLDPKDGLPGFLAVEAAEALLERGQAAAANDRIQPFLPRDPTNPRLWHTASKARLRLGDLKGADTAIRRAIALAPGLEFLRYTQAELLRAQEDEEGVRTVLQAILASNPRAVEAALELSAMAIRSGDREGSKAVLRAAQAAGASDPDLLDRLGGHAVLDGKDAEARAYFTQSLALWPEDPVALLALGQADPAHARSGGRDRVVAAVSVLRLPDRAGARPGRRPAGPAGREADAARGAGAGRGRAAARRGGPPAARARQHGSLRAQLLQKRGTQRAPLAIRKTPPSSMGGSMRALRVFLAPAGILACVLAPPGAHAARAPVSDSCRPRVLAPPGFTATVVPWSFHGARRGPRRDPRRRRRLRVRGGRAGASRWTAAPEGWPSSRAPASRGSSGARPRAAGGSRPWRAFLRRYPALFQVEEAQLVLDTKASVRVGERGQYWQVVFRQEASGIPVEHARVLFRVSSGRLVQFGVDRTVPMAASLGKTAGLLTAAQAKDALAGYVGTLLSGDRFTEDGTLLWVPRGVDGPIGAGWRPEIVYRFTFLRAGSTGSWQALVDAKTGEVLRFVDDTDYAALVKASVYTLTNCTDPELCAGFRAVETGVTLPHAALLRRCDLPGNACYTNSRVSTAIRPGGLRHHGA